MDPFAYLLSSPLKQKKLQMRLPETIGYKICLHQEERREGVLLDTFTLELLQANQLLFQTGDMLLLYEPQTGKCHEQPAPLQWSFVGELDKGPVAARLKHASRLRALLPVANVGLELSRGLLLDDEKKTRARLYHLTIFHRRRTVGVGCTQYLRGYDNAHEELCRCLEGTGAQICQDASQIYTLLGIKAAAYSAKPAVPLEPGTSASASAKTIIRAFIAVARRNEKGLAADHDTEFLHDYRVSLRKVRSVLSLFKGVFGNEETAQLKKDFAALMQKTNTLRDLDVYLLNKKQYFALVPQETHEGLEILFDHFAAIREKEQRAVSRIVRSKVYRDEIERLDKIFKPDSRLTIGSKGEESSLEFASRLVRKRYAKVCGIARTIDNKTEDSVIHQLRIHCKKLRYLLEFFTPLFAESEMKTLIAALKLLQDNLGRFNDYSVQKEFLGQILDQKIPALSGKEIVVAGSVGALTAMLHRLQLKERRLVMKNFARFDSSEVRSIVAKLFNPEGSEDENNSLLQ